MQGRAEGRSSVLALGAAKPPLHAAGRKRQSLMSASGIDARMGEDPEGYSRSREPGPTGGAPTRPLTLLPSARKMRDRREHEQAEQEHRSEDVRRSCRTLAPIEHRAFETVLGIEVSLPTHHCGVSFLRSFGMGCVKDADHNPAFFSLAASSATR